MSGSHAQVLGRHQHRRAEALDLQRPAELVAEHRVQAVRREHREGDEARGRDRRRTRRRPRGRSACPRRRQRWTTAIGSRTAGQSLAANPSPSSAPLTSGRSRTRAASAPTASSVGHRSKRVSKSEPRTSGETPIVSSATHVRIRAGADRPQRRRRGSDAAGAADAHEHRERRRVAPAHVARQEHGRQRSRRVLEREVAVRDVAAADELGVVDVDRHVRELALLEPADERVERDPEQDGGCAGRDPRPRLSSHSTSNSSATAGSSPISSGTPPRSGSSSPYGDQPEAVLRLVENPDVALRQKGQVLAQLLERRLRFVQAPDQDPGGQNGPLAS